MTKRTVPALLVLLAFAHALPAAALDLQSTTAPGRTVPSLSNGEIAINRADKSLFFKNVDGTIGVGSLLNALPSGRKAVEQGLADDLSVTPANGQNALTLKALLSTVVLPEAYGAVGDGVTPDHAAINAAIGAAAARGGGTVLIAKPYAIGDTIEVRSGVVLRGVGYDALWEPGATGHTIKGGVLVAVGTGPRKFAAYGITDERTSGGRIDNSADADFGATDATMALSDWYNQDANPTTGAAATPRLFSAAVHLGPGTTGAQIQSLRVLLNHTGVAGYNAGTLTLGDEWDVGLYVDNARRSVVRDSQVVGYWRKAGRFERCSALPTEVAGTFAGCENNLYDNVLFQGHKASATRSAGMWSVTARTANTIEIPWADNHPFDPAVRGFVTVGEFTPAHYAFTGVSKSGDKLTLTGVTPNPSDIALGASLYQQQFSNGVAQSRDINCRYMGMYHFSGRRISDPAIAGAMPPSAAIEVSGMRLRQREFALGKLQTTDDIGIHLHQSLDTVLRDMSFEASTPASGGAGFRNIASPPAAFTATALTGRAPYPTPNAYTMRPVLNLIQGGGDFTPQFGAAPAKFSTPGFWDPATPRVVDAFAGILLGGAVDANRLRLFQQNGFTVSLAVATPGDFSASSLIRSGDMTRVNGHVQVHGLFQATVSYSTAAGAIRVNLPFVAQTKTGYAALTQVALPGFTFPTGYTYAYGRVESGMSYMSVYLRGASGERTLNIGDYTSGGTLRIDFSGSYVTQ